MSCKRPFREMDSGRPNRKKGERQAERGRYINPPEVGVLKEGARDTLHSSSCVPNSYSSLITFC